MVYIPEHIFTAYPNFRLQVWFCHYFRTLIIFETKAGAEKFIRFHLERRNRIRRQRGRKTPAQQKDYDVSNTLLGFNLRCVDDLTFKRNGTAGFRLGGSRNPEPKFQFGSPEYRKTENYRNLQRELEDANDKKTDLEETLAGMDVDALKEEKQGFLQGIKDVQSEIDGLYEDISNNKIKVKDLDTKRMNLRKKSGKRKASSSLNGGSSSSSNSSSSSSSSNGSGRKPPRKKKR
jgi:hypothetical protein